MSGGLRKKFKGTKLYDMLKKITPASTTYYTRDERLDMYPKKPKRRPSKSNIPQYGDKRYRPSDGKGVGY